MLKFIQTEATDAQIKVLLMDGEIVRLDEQSEEIVNERFEQSYLKQSYLNEEAFVVAGILGASVMMASVGWVTWRSIKAIFSEKTRRCDAYSIGIKRKACYADIEIQRLKKTIGLVKQQTSACSRSKNPKKCLEKNKNAVRKLQLKLSNAQKKARKYIMKNPKKASIGKDNAARDSVRTSPAT